MYGQAGSSNRCNEVIIVLCSLPRGKLKLWVCTMIWNFWNRNSTTVSLQIHMLLKTVLLLKYILKISWEKMHVSVFILYLKKLKYIQIYYMNFPPRKLLQLRSSVSLCIVSTFPFWFYSICYYYYFHFFPFLFAKQETEDKRFAYE